MNPEHQTFILFKDWGSTIAKMSVEEKAAVFDALFSYTKGEPYAVPSSVSFFFEFMIEQIEKNDEKWTETQERCKNAGRLGGLAKSNNAKQRLANSSDPKQPLAPLSDPKQPLATPSNNVNVNVNANVNNTKESVPKGTPKKVGLSLNQFNEILSEFSIFENNKELRKSLISYLEMRKKRSGTSAVKTPDSLRKLIKKAVKLGEGSPERMIDIFDNSTAMSYQGLFLPDELKKQPKEKTDIVDAGAYFQSLVDKEAN